LDVSALKGIKVATGFKPSTAADSVIPGSVPAAKKSWVWRRDDPDVQPVNVVTPIKGVQAAVTFGVGISTQELNDAVHKSGLVTVGPAHGVSKSNLCDEHD
jgi:hypothetical protein